MAMQEIIYGTSILFQVFVSFTSLSLESVIHKLLQLYSARRKQKWEEMQERKRMEAEALRSKQFLTSITNPFHMSIIINGTTTNVFLFFFDVVFLIIIIFFIGQRKGLETIKFTLLDSDSAVEKGWAVRPESRVVEDARTTKKKRKESRFKKEKTVTPQEMFLPETLERLQLVSPPCLDE